MLIGLVLSYLSFGFFIFPLLPVADNKQVVLCFGHVYSNRLPSISQVNHNPKISPGGQIYDHLDPRSVTSQLGFFGPRGPSRFISVVGYNLPALETLHPRSD